MEVKFGEIQVGNHFFDPYSGSYWTKTDTDEAVLEEGNTGGFDKDCFSFDEIVIIE